MSAEAIQKQLSDEVAKFNQLQNDMQKVIRMRQQLEGQLTENTIVKEVRDAQTQQLTLTECASGKGTGSAGRRCQSL